MKGKLTGFNRVAIIRYGCIDYHYALYDDNINAGDEVLVSGVNKNIVTIIEIISLEEAKFRYNKDIIEEVICKIDRTDYLKRVVDRKTAKEILKKMDKRIAELDNMKKYEWYAEKDEELKEMLSEYLELVG